MVNVSTAEPRFRSALEACVAALRKVAGVFHYNAVPVAASPTLIGKYLYLLDNQGNCVILDPGREFKQIAINKIGTQLKREWPTTPQEIISYAPIFPDGKRLFIRGERYLYCIGE